MDDTLANFGHDFAMTDRGILSLRTSWSLDICDRGLGRCRDANQAAISALHNMYLCGTASAGRGLPRVSVSSTLVRGKNPLPLARRSTGLYKFCAPPPSWSLDIFIASSAITKVTALIFLPFSSPV